MKALQLPDPNAPVEYVHFWFSPDRALCGATTPHDQCRDFARWPTSEGYPIINAQGCPDCHMPLCPDCSAAYHAPRPARGIGNAP